MKPVPMTAAPMSAILLMPCAHPRWSCARLSRRSRGSGSAQRRGRSFTAARFGLSPPRILLSSCQVQKSSLDGVRSGVCIATWTESPTDLDGRRPARSAGRGPLPDEALDALVTVLDEIRLGRSRSRSELVARTGLGRAIVAQRVGELIERGLVTEGDVGPSTGGRPPRQLTFRADGGHVLVADLGATSIDVAVTTLDGRILGHHDEPARIEAGPGALPGPRRRAVRRRCSRTTQGLPGRLWGIGIGVPGPGRVRDRAARSRRRSCPAGTATRSASGSPRATARRSGSTTTSTCWPSGSGGRASRPATTTSSWSRSGRASAPGSSRTATSTAARRAVPATSATSRSSTTRRSSAAAATSAASRRWPAARRSAGPGEAAARRGPEPAAADRPRPARHGHRRGRRPGRVVRRPGRGRAPRLGRPAGRVDARERRQLLQPVAHRHRRRRREQPGPAARRDPRDGLPPVAAAGDPRPARSSARRSAAWPASSARRRWSSTSSSRAMPIGRWIEAGEPSGSPEVAVGQGG